MGGNYCGRTCMGHCGYTCHICVHIQPVVNLCCAVGPVHTAFDDHSFTVVSKLSPLTCIRPLTKIAAVRARVTSQGDFLTARSDEAKPMCRGRFVIRWCWLQLCKLSNE
jgi:hypothetical protein